MKDIIAKYLANYTEQEVNYLPVAKFTNYQFVLTIPCFDEAFTNLEAILTNPNFSNVLVIVVINRPDTIDRCLNNEKLLATIDSTFEKQWQQDNLLFYKNNYRDLLIVDRGAINVKQGVGCARKIAGDLAVKLIDSDKIASKWLFCTDMDTVLPDNYFDDYPQTNNTVAMLTIYRHIPTDNSALNTAINDYEQYLENYQRQLTKAGSKYNWIALGSTVIIDCLAYAQVRGFPKLAAGEDFYMLNKLNKIGNIQKLQDISVSIETRLSHRVPFGTGPRLKSIIENNKLPNYDAGFVLLKEWLDCYRQLFDGVAFEQLSLPNKVATYLQSIGVESWLQQAHTVAKSDYARFCDSINNNFDALKTLQFLKEFEKSDNFSNN